MPLHGKRFNFLEVSLKMSLWKSMLIFPLFLISFRPCLIETRFFHLKFWFFLLPSYNSIFLHQNKPVHQWRTWIIFVLVSSLLMRGLYLEYQDWFYNPLCNLFFSITEERNCSATTGGLQITKSNMTNKFHIKYLKNLNVH